MKELTAFTMKRRDLVYLITYIGYASIYLARIDLSMAGPDLKAAGVLTTAQLGFLGTAFSVVYATGRLLNSMWADSIEPRTMIGTGLLFTGLASIGVGFLPPFFGILLFWCVNAFAQSMLWSSVLRIVHALYDAPAKRTSRLSLIVSTVAAGQVAGILISMAVLGGLGLRWAFLVPGLITLLMGTVVLAVYPLIDKKTAEGSGPEKTEASGVTVSLEKAEASGTPAPLEKDRAAGVKSPVEKGGKPERNPFKKMKEVLQFEEVWLSLLPGTFMGLMKDNVTLWMTVYFVDTYGIDLQSTTGYVLFIPVVGLAARLLFPAALKLCGGNEHLVSLWTFVGSFVASLVLILVKNPLAAVVALSMVYACMSLTNSSMLSIFPARFAKQGCMAAVSGVIDFVAYLGAGLGSMVFGLTIDARGYGTMFVTWAVLSVIGYIFMKKLCTYGRT